MTDQFTVWHYDRIGSTNDEAHRMASEGAPHGTVIHADEQTAGRGRLAHTWFSPPGNLYLSVLLRTGQPAARSAELSFLAALAVADTVEALLPRQIRAMLKWPNDVLINGAKIAGILLEQVDDATVLGIGLNVLEAPSNLAYKATTIVANGGIASVDGARDILLPRLAAHLVDWQAEGFRGDPRAVAQPVVPDRRGNPGEGRRAVDRWPLCRSGYGRRSAARHATGPPADRCRGNRGQK